MTLITANESSERSALVSCQVSMPTVGILCLVTVGAHSGPGRYGRLWYFLWMKGGQTTSRTDQTTSRTSQTVSSFCWPSCLQTYLKDRENPKSLSFNGSRFLMDSEAVQNLDDPLIRWTMSLQFSTSQSHVCLCSHLTFKAAGFTQARHTLCS